MDTETIERVYNDTWNRADEFKASHQATTWYININEGMPITNIEPPRTTWAFSYMIATNDLTTVERIKSLILEFRNARWDKGADEALKSLDAIIQEIEKQPNIVGWWL